MGLSMSDHLQRVGSYLNHLAKARTAHGVHSPFVYELVTQVIRERTVLPEFAAIERLREDLWESDQTIRVNDLGAGSRVLDLPVRSVADMARSAMKPARQGQLLFRLARYFRPRTVLELGTSFGISTLYLAMGADEGEVTTIEGCPQTYRIAQHHFDQMRCGTIHPHLGSFKTQLPEVLKRLDHVDLVFFDGHHLKEPTLDYFMMCMEHTSSSSVLVFDDIHWSRGMEEAWEVVKAHPRVTVTIDLYDMGLVFLRTEQATQHFRIRY